MWTDSPTAVTFPRFTGIALSNVNEYLQAMFTSLIRTLKGQQTFLRGQAVNWRLNPKDRNEVLEKALFGLWNGIRRLPYSDEQIARSMAYCVVHFKVGYRMWPDWMEVEFSNRRLGKSRAVVSAAALRSACAYDLADMAKRIGIVLDPGAQGMRQILAHVFQPELLFKFAEFSDVFVQQIVPYQQLASEERGYSIIYAVGELHTFGLP